MNMAPFSIPSCTGDTVGEYNFKMAFNPRSMEALYLALCDGSFAGFDQRNSLLMKLTFKWLNTLQTCSFNVILGGFQRDRMRQS